jgi:hypothetical protein
MKKFMFAIFALVLMSSVAMAQNPADLIHFTATVAQVPIEVTPGEVIYDALAAGQCYQAPADPLAVNTITPQIGGESVETVESEIAGDPFGNVQVSFTLPTTLYPSGGGSGRVTLTYNNLSAAWGPSGAESNFFNPEDGVSFGLDVDGAGFVVLSADPCVSVDATADDFEGDAVIVVQPL